jgi:DNA-binding transcriptional regulator WhiA
MARRWTKSEEKFYRNELIELYVNKNMTINEVGGVLGLYPQSIYDRLKRLGVPTQPWKKKNYLKKRTHVRFPSKSEDLAEFIGIMLGDGHISHFQVVVHLGTKEKSYALHVSTLMDRLFEVKSKISTRKTGHKDVYFGSVDVVKWLMDEHGLVHNKVKSQASIPNWIYTDPLFVTGCTRGLFDTDGSVYALRFGIQISFTNYSIPLLQSMRKMLLFLNYNPSKVGKRDVYLTRKNEVVDFFQTVKPQNKKHVRRFEQIMKTRR